MARDALSIHARGELGISEVTTARPIQAALTSAATFAVGAAIPLALAFLMPPSLLVAGVAIASLVFMALLEGIGARAGGADIAGVAVRVPFLGRNYHGTDGRHWRNLRYGRMRSGL